MMRQLQFITAFGLAVVFGIALASENKPKTAALKPKLAAPKPAAPVKMPELSFLEPISTTVRADREEVIRPIAKLELPRVGAFSEVTLESVPIDYPPSDDRSDEAKLYNQIVRMVQKRQLNDAVEQTAKYFKKYPKGKLHEAMVFLKADILFFTQEALGTIKYDISIKEYDYAISAYPEASYIPRGLYQIGLGYLRMGFHYECQTAMDRAIKDFAQHALMPKYLLILGEQYFKEKKFVQAEDVFHRLVTNYPKAPEALDGSTRRALICVIGGDPDKAVPIYQDLLATHPTALDGKISDAVFYGYTLIGVHQYDKAIRVLQKLYNHDPRDPVAPYMLYLMAETTFLVGQADTAYRLFRETAVQYPETLGGKMSMLRAADIFFVTGKYDAYPRSIQIYDAVAKSTENETIKEMALLRKGAVLYNLAMYREARRLYLDFISSNPGSSFLNHAKQMVSRALEREIEGLYEREDYLGALSIYLTHEGEYLATFENTDVLLKLGESAFELAARDKAKEIFKKVIYLRADRSNREIAILKLTEILIDEGGLDEAIDRLRRFEFAYPDSELKWKYYALWGDLFFKQKNLEKAQEGYLSSILYSRSQLKDVRDNAYSYWRLSKIYEELHDLPKAIEYLDIFSNLVAFDESKRLNEAAYGNTLYRLGDLYFKIESYRQAIEAYEKAIGVTKKDVFYFHALSRMATAYVRLQMKPKAMELWQRIEKEDPADIWGKMANGKLSLASVESKYGFDVLK